MDTWKKYGDGYTSRGISISVSYSEEAIIEDTFDLGIFFGTFESRGLVSSRLLSKSACSHSLIVFFDEAKLHELRVKNDEVLSNQVRKCTISEPKIVENISIKSIDDVVCTILKSVPLECWNAGARWFIDIGGAPIPCYIGLIAALREVFPSPFLTVFNPTATYPDEKKVYKFTSGLDKNIWVPYLWGSPDPLLPWLYVFMLGYEGHRSFEIFESCEPTYVKTIVGHPGYEQDSKEKALESNKMFLRESGCLNEDGEFWGYECHSSDPVDTWKTLEDIRKDWAQKANICFVPIGTKAHALAAGLCAITDGVPSVLYHMPRAYGIRDIQRGKYLWKYEIKL